MTLTPSPWVALLNALFKLRRDHTQDRCPSIALAPVFQELRDVPYTSQPKALATCSAAKPTPEAMA